MQRGDGEEETSGNAPVATARARCVCMFVPSAHVKTTHGAALSILRLLTKLVDLESIGRNTSSAQMLRLAL